MSEDNTIRASDLSDLEKEIFIKINHIQSEVSHKPSGWVIFGIMLAALALPIAVLAVWIPREFDATNGKIDKVSELVTELSEKYDSIYNLVEGASRQAKALNYNVSSLNSRADAQEAGIARIMATSIAFSEERDRLLSAYFPEYVVQSWPDRSFTGGISAAEFEDTTYIFVDPRVRGELSESERNTLIKLAEKPSFRIKYETLGELPSD